eukprot:TRINITY_DN9141_c0_g1_i2.p1 TRINITY_DN9141_c0_g1~~TRINITY_DN9141_c0_g1_i2.p1  ORF type:complete len:332 (-),score=15.57 TRINITY_DN9141_c0_g1_i2:392-1387(-)
MWTTDKHVTVQDAGLHWINTIGVTLVVVYVGLFEMLYRGAHLEVVDVDGVHQMHLKAPTINYCNERENGCAPDYSSTANTPYCSDSKLAYAGIKHECELWSSREAEMPEGDAVSLTTRVQMYNVTKICKPSARKNLTCPDGIWNHTLLKDSYVMDAERFWFWMEHTMASAKVGWSSKSIQLKGYYKSCASQSCPYKEILSLPDDFGTVQDAANKQPPLPVATQSGEAKKGERSTKASFLQSGTMPSSATSSRPRSRVMARESQSSLQTTNIRSHRVAKRRVASSAGLHWLADFSVVGPVGHTTPLGSQGIYKSKISHIRSLGGTRLLTRSK